MYVKVEFIVKTPEFGKEEFKQEIEKLIADIDPISTKLISFDMHECNEPIKAFQNVDKKGQL